MKKSIFFTSCIALFISCVVKTPKNLKKTNLDTDFVIAFGSCNKQYKPNLLWKEIAKNEPNLWIWGGDNIYADTYDMKELRKDYQEQMKQKGYEELIKNTPIMATWDDHDYAVNDAGVEHKMKKESQQLFLDFLNVDKNDARRKQEGIYHSQVFKTKKGSIKVIVLDTRYFRTAMTRADIKGKKRYQPNTYGKGTILGKTQWSWLNKELKTSKADFNLIVSSIQFLSAEHGFEKWGNYPHEVDKMKTLLVSSKAKNVLFLSGDRHISEFSKTAIEGFSSPLIDFTSSGLTHTYSSFSGEPNKTRIKNVVFDISFGVLKFNFDANKITMEMRGKENILQQELIQVYD